MSRCTNRLLIATSIESQISLLSSYSLLMPSEITGSFSIHCFVHEWARERQTLYQQRYMVERAITVIATAVDAVQKPELRRWSFERQILPHITESLRWAVYIPHVGINPVGYYHWNILGSVCKHQGKYEDAEKLYRLANEHLSLEPGLEIKKAEVTLEIASVCAVQKKLDEAAQLSTLVLQQIKRISGSHNLEIRSLSILASVLSLQNRFAEAMQHYRSALAQSEDFYGFNHPQTLRLVRQLATKYREYDQVEKTEMLLRRELLSLEEQVGIDQPLTMTIQRELTAVYQDQGKYEEAEILLRRSLEVYEATFGCDHIGTVDINARLAVLCDLQGRFDESLILYEHALASKAKMLGHSHPATLKVFENMALSYRMQGKYREAEDIYHTVLRTREKTEYNTEETQRISARLAEVYEEQGRATKMKRHCTTFESGDLEGKAYCSLL